MSVQSCCQCDVDTALLACLFRLQGAHQANCAATACMDSRGQHRWQSLTTDVPHVWADAQ